MLLRQHRYVQDPKGVHWLEQRKQRRKGSKGSVRDRQEPHYLGCEISTIQLSAHGLLGYKLLATCLWQEKELCRCKSTMSPKTLLVEPIQTYAHTQTHTPLSRLSQWEKVCAALQICSDGNSFWYIQNVYLVVGREGYSVIKFTFQNDFCDYRYRVRGKR